ncbi:hypothetical protein NYO67_3812 [Aspergillus flavus]|nr:hypothetical protein NYO67_3812 [Aspergillus flavus]
MRSRSVNLRQTIWLVVELQELVLSKVTFYVNPNWDLLERPIDDLGQYYNLCPFIDLYTRNQEHATSKENISIAMAALPAQDVQDLLNGKRQQERTGMTETGDILESITDTLGAFNFAVPKNLDEETARTRIGQCVRSTIKSLQRLRLEHGGDTSIHPLKLYSLIAGTIHGTLSDSQPKTVDIYKERRIKIVIDLLLSALAKLKNHEIRADREHIARFSKVQCLKSWSRGTGRATISAHSVMNLASARECTVPTDIAYSLMGILGVRFPAFPAEGLTKALARSMDEVVIASNDVSVFNWSGKHNGSPIRGRSLYASNISGFRVENTELQENFDADQELMRYFQPEQSKDILWALYDHVKLLKEDDFRTLRNSFDLKPIYDKMKAAKIDAKEEGLEDGHQQPLIPGDSRGQQAPDGKRQEMIENNDPPELSNLAPHVNVRWCNDEKERRKQEKDAQNREKEGAEKRRLDRSPVFDKEVKNAIEQALSKRSESNICQDPYDKVHTEGGSEDKVTVNETEPLESLDRRIISPNPIVLNSSGIKGVFDISASSLRQKIKTAISVNDKIDGWCTISTGLALTMVAFSCERHVLAQQLDLVEVVEETVLKDPHAKLDGISEQLQRSEYRHNAETNTESYTTSEEDIRQGLKKPERSSTERSDLTTNPKTMKIQYGNSPEQRKLFRMLDFVTESNIQIVAGEWVLARFSSAPGAKWFLCRLELGAGTEFYARRIPTDEIDFTEAFPERGLVEYWHAFLLEQKSIMCDVLSFHLDSKKAGKYTDWLGESIINSLSGDVTSDQNEDESCDDDVDLARNPRSRDYGHLSNVRKMIKMIGWSAKGVLSETWASHLNRYLRDNALRKVPVHLRAAVEALSDRRVLLPAMFHTGKEIHFF